MSTREREVAVGVDGDALHGTLATPGDPRGLVVFAHGSGSSRWSPRNRRVAAYLHQAGLATLLLDLLTPAEESLDAQTGDLRFDVPFLAGRLLEATAWVRNEPLARHLPLGYFGASTGAAAALVAAAAEPRLVQAIVSRGGRPDLAGEALARVTAPTLLLVGGEDREVIALNRRALHEMRTPAALEVIPGATHLFSEPGALERVAELAAGWFATYLVPAARSLETAPAS